MVRCRKLFILLVSLPLVLGACFNLKQPNNKIHFYTLEYPPPQINSPPLLPVVIRVQRFHVAPLYNSSRIIYQDESFKRDAYVYHKWRSNPGDLVAHYLSRDMKEIGLFKAVLTQESSFTSSYRLGGTVDQFFERDHEEGWEAVLSLSVSLLAENEMDPNRRVLFQKIYRATEPCNQKNPAGLAEAMSRAMKKLTWEIIDDVYKSLGDHSQGAQTLSLK